jgi:hypothetical protein
MAQRTMDPMAGEGRQEGAYNAEHWLSWGLLFVSLALGLVGLLRGFGILGDDAEGTTIGVGAPGTQAASLGALWDSAVWFLSAIALGLLSTALHRTEHHRAAMHVTERDRERVLWSMEHGLAWLMTLLTVGSAALGILVGFDLLGRGNDQPDALPWLFAALHYGVLTMTLHAVGHHQVVSDADDIARMTEVRAGAASTRSTAEYGTQPGTPRH